MTTFLPGCLSTYLPPEYPAEVFLNAHAPYFDGAQQTWHFSSAGSVLHILTDPALEVSYAAPSIAQSWTYAGPWSRSGKAQRDLSLDGYGIARGRPVTVLLCAPNRRAPPPVPHLHTPPAHPPMPTH